MSNISPDAARMAALSRIAYLNPPRNMKPEYNMNELIEYWEKNEKSKITKDQGLSDAINLIKNDRYFNGMTVAGFSSCILSGMQAYCFRTNTNEGVLAFRGTEFCFKDTVVATLGNDYPQMAAAGIFVKEMERKGFSTMRATGHSLGGKLAEYAALVSNNIDRCDVFNPKNFSEKEVRDYKHLADGKNMNRYVNYDGDGNFTGGFRVGIGDFRVGPDFCKDNDNLNFGRGIRVDGKDHSMDNILSDAWNSGNHMGSISMGGAAAAGLAGAVAFGTVSNKRIKVSIPELRNKVASFKDHLRKLERFLKRLDDVITTLSQISWVSPATRALSVKFKLLYKTVEVSLRIVEKYIFDLEEAIKLYTETENRVTDKVNNLQTDVFNV